MLDHAEFLAVLITGKVAILAGPGGPVLGFLSWDFRLKWLMGSWPWARFVRAWSCLRVGAGRVSREC